MFVNRNMSRRLFLAVTAGAAVPLAGAGSILQPSFATLARRTAQDFYVTTEPELVNALSAALPGDTITMQDRTWFDLGIVIDRSASHGMAGSPILLRAETRGGVVLSGFSTLRIGRDYWIVDGLVFEDGMSTNDPLPTPVIYFSTGPSDPQGAVHAHNSEVRHIKMADYNPPNPTIAYNWVQLRGAFNRVSYCSFTGKNNVRDLMSGDRKQNPGAPWDHQVDHNYFADIPQGGGNGFGAVTTGSGLPLYQEAPDHMIIEHNLFRRCDGEGELITVKSSENIVRHNTIVESIGYISLRRGHAAEIYGNYFFGEGAGGSARIRVNGEDHKIYNNYMDLTTSAPRGIVVNNGWDTGNNQEYFTPKNVDIVNNTIVNSNQEGIAIGRFLGGSNDGTNNFAVENINTANNIVWTPNGCALEYGGHPSGDPDFEPGGSKYLEPISPTYEGNIMHSAPICVSPVPLGIDHIDPVMSGVQINGYTVFKPSSGSPAIDGAAGSYAYVDADIEGKSRPAGSSSDVGAHEDSTDAVIYPPLAGADVGPSYIVIP